MKTIRQRMAGLLNNVEPAKVSVLGCLLRGHVSTDEPVSVGAPWLRD